MKGKIKKKPPLTPKQRSERFDAKMRKFDIKRLYFRASATQRGLIDELKKLCECNSREELVHMALVRLGAEHGITLADIKEDLECLRRSQK